jgi:hypothetical protein
MSMPSWYISQSGLSSRSLATFLLDGVDRVVDLFLGREAADGHAQAAVRQFVAAAQGAQHVAGFQRSRRAGRAGRHRQALDAHDQRLALDEVEADVQVVRHAPAGAIAVDEHLLDVLQAVQQALLQRARVRCPAPSLPWRCGRPRPCRRSGAWAACPSACRARGRRRASALPGARAACGARTARRCPWARRSCASQAHEVDRQRLDVDLDLAGGLRRVDVEDDPALAAHRADRGDVLDDADLVVDEHDADQDGVGRRAALNFSRSSRPSSCTSR